MEQCAGASLCADMFCLCAGTSEALPAWVCMSSYEVMVKLRAREGNAPFYRELVRMLSGVLATVEGPHFCTLATALLDVAQHEAKINLELETLACECR